LASKYTKQSNLPLINKKNATRESQQKFKCIRGNEKKKAKYADNMSKYRKSCKKVKSGCSLPDKGQHLTYQRNAARVVALNKRTCEYQVTYNAIAGATSLIEASQTRVAWVSAIVYKTKCKKRKPKLKLKNCLEIKSVRKSKSWLQNLKLDLNTIKKMNTNTNK
jgi:hypothetical protein